MRHWFGQSLTDWTFTVGGGGEAVLAGGVEITCWSQPVGGSRYTDLLDESGTSITSVVSSDGSGGLPLGTIPRFQGPSDVTAMWADAGAGTRWLMLATDIGDVIPAVEQAQGQIAAHVAGDNPHSTGLSDLVDVDASSVPADGDTLIYDADTGTWRPGDVQGIPAVTLDGAQTITGPKILQPPDVNTTPLRIRFSGDRNPSTASLFLVEYLGLDGQSPPRRTTEINERGMLRITSPVEPQVMLRLRADPAQTADALQLTDLNNVPRMWVDIAGRVRAPNISVIPPFGIAGEVAVQSGGGRWYNDTGQSLTIRSVRASVGTAPVGADLIVDVNISGVSIFTAGNRPTIPAGSNTSGAVTALAATTIPTGGYLTVDVDQVGSSTPGADLVVQILAY
mgnify:FL=1